jgi:DNA modification methylase
MGSGTTIISMLASGRKAIGCEINAETFEIAKKRISRLLTNNGTHFSVK